MSRPSPDVERPRAEISAEIRVPVGTMPKAEGAKGTGNLGTGTENIMKNKTLKNSKWLKVSQLKVGQKIAVRPSAERPAPEIEHIFDTQGQGTDIMWDEIVAIKPVGREQVYDIEVEGTHNFVGNDIFAHNTYINMTGNVGIGITTPTAKLQVNDSEETSFVVTSEGRVGIGTTTPSYKLSVSGDVAATAFVNISTRTSKVDIQYLSGEEEKNILEKIKSANLATYHYSIEDSANPKRLGLIAEEAPAEVLSIDGKGVDIYKLSSFILAGVKAQQVQIEDIKTRVTVLENKNNIGPISPIGPIADALTQAITVAKSTLANIVSTMGDWANAALAETTKLIKSGEDETNITYKTYSVQGSRDEVIASGSATMVMGSDASTGAQFAGIKIKFDESFTSIISETENIKVILTPTTRLNGALYVHSKSRFGFEVREINATDEGGMFDWMVVARKKGADDANLQMNANDTNTNTNEEAPPATEEPSSAEAMEGEPVVEEPASEPILVEEVVTPPVEEIVPAPTPAEGEVGAPTESVGTETTPVIIEPSTTTPPAEEPVP